MQDPKSVPYERVKHSDTATVPGDLQAWHHLARETRRISAKGQYVAYILDFLDKNKKAIRYGGATSTELTQVMLKATVLARKVKELECTALLEEEDRRRHSLMRKGC